MEGFADMYTFEISNEVANKGTYCLYLGTTLLCYDYVRYTVAKESTTCLEVCNFL